MATIDITPEVSLDGRLALYHRNQRWLALADTHYGYSHTMREAGGLFPFWGNQTIGERIRELCSDYTPDTLIINGDLVHGRVQRKEFSLFLAELNALAPQLILIQGNHDRSPTVNAAPFVQSYQTDGFFFHHGHLDTLEIPSNTIEVTGHFHPAVSMNDGAGLRLKLPALICETSSDREQWVLPAFSPWAGGMAWPSNNKGMTRTWICSPARVFEWL